MTAPIAIITPAHNEAEHLPRLIASMLGQRRRPDVWLIVSDRSDDETDDLAKAAAAQHDFIRFARHEGDTIRDFARKVAAIDHGAALIDIEPDFFGITDADVEFPPDYFARLVAAFDADPKLGLAGGLVVDVDRRGGIHRRPGRPDIVPGAVQLYRRACWEDVGGFHPLEFGSEDTVACLSAQMHGWKTTVVEDLVVRHHRAGGTANRSLLGARYREGRRDRATGYHPVFAVAKAIRRFGEPPFLLGSLARLVGFVRQMLDGRPTVDPSVVDHLRDAQLRELHLRR